MESSAARPLTSGQPSPRQADHVVHGGDLELYQNVVASRIAKIEATRQPCQENFQCRITETAIGHIRVTQIQSSPFALTRSESCIAADRHNEYLIGLNLAGDMLVDHYRYQTAIKATHMFLLDKAAPYQTTFKHDSDRIIFSIPRRLIEHQLPNPAHYLQCTPSISDGIGNLAYRHLLLLMQQGDRLNDVTRTQLTQMCLDMVALSFRSYGDATTVPTQKHSTGRILLSNVKAYLHTVLSDPELNPSVVAESMGLSKRYLHKLFSDSGTTFGAWIRDERLMRARTLLADPRLQYLSIKEIALQQGFNDIPNFSRQFKAKYQQTPSSLREDACRHIIQPDD